jgi:polyphosphate glucokinase
MIILVIDIGGTHVKLLASGQTEMRRFNSSLSLTPSKMVSGVLELAKDWKFEAISIGYPGPVLHGKPVAEPHNLGKGWLGFDYAKAFGKPVRIINDAAMQALGGYETGKMLFLGLGTGLGTAMIVDGIIEPMELAHLPYKKATFEDYVGQRGIDRLGKKRWAEHVADVIERLRAALEPDEVVLGGGNAAKLKLLPKNVRLGDNANAFAGGFKLWPGAVKAVAVKTETSKPVTPKKSASKKADSKKADSSKAASTKSVSSKPASKKLVSSKSKARATASEKPTKVKSKTLHQPELEPRANAQPNVGGSLPKSSYINF